MRMDVVAVDSADRQEDFNRCGERESAHPEAADGRHCQCGRAANEAPFGGGIVRRLIERIVGPEQESFDRSEAEDDLADDEGGERTTRHLK